MRKWEVDLTLIETWIGSLDDEEYDHLIAALEQLEEYGPGDAPAIRGHWTKWYATNVPIADRLFTEHQQKMKQAATAAKSKASKGKKR